MTVPMENSQVPVFPVYLKNGEEVKVNGKIYFSMPLAIDSVHI